VLTTFGAIGLIRGALRRAKIGGWNGECNGEWEEKFIATTEERAGFSYWILTRINFCERSYSVLFVILRYQRTAQRGWTPMSAWGVSCFLPRWCISARQLWVLRMLWWEINVKKTMVIWDVDGI
jgi:hypothetical protein